MRKSTFTEEQIAYALREAESGTPVLEVCRKLGISEQSFYRWKRKFAGMGIAELRRWALPSCGGDSSKKRIAGRESPLEAVGGGFDAGPPYAPGGDQKKAVKPAQQRLRVEFVRVGFRTSERRACGVIGYHRSTYR
jgi:hypothetical protein